MNRQSNLITPAARVDDFVVQELSEEVLVYDLESHDAHCLNPAAAIVWKHCDGRTTVAELTAILSRALGTAVTEEYVWVALDRLERANLLIERLPRAGVSRRDIMKRALTVAAAVPLVASVAAPAAAQTVSCTPDAPNCHPNGNNDAGVCVASIECCSCCCQPDEGDPANSHCTSNSNNCL